MNKNLFEGVKILDFSWALVGPFTTKSFSDYGAQVIKIEGKTRPDSMRVLGPFKDNVLGFNRSASFNHINTSKLSVSLNLTNSKGVEVAKKLVSWADIVVENFSGGTMRKMGLGYDALVKIKPDIIMLSSCMMGQTGPFASSPATGYQLSALSGFNSITGWPGQAPIGPAGAYTDFVAPHFNTLAILAALIYKENTGRGQYIDASQYEACLHLMAPIILDYAVNNRLVSRIGNRHLYAAPHGAYRCLGEDSWCAIAVFNDEQWRILCKIIGHPNLINEQKFKTLLARKENEDELDKLIEAWTIKHSSKEVMTMMQENGIPSGVLETAKELQEHDPQLKHRRFYVKLEHPEVGCYIAPRPLWSLSKCSCEVKRAPLLGEHNEYVLKEILGMSEDEIANLIIDGAVE